MLSGMDYPYGSDGLRQRNGPLRSVRYIQGYQHVQDREKRKVQAVYSGRYSVPDGHVLHNLRDSLLSSYVPWHRLHIRSDSQILRGWIQTIIYRILLLFPVVVCGHYSLCLPMLFANPAFFLLVLQISEGALFSSYLELFAGNRFWLCFSAGK